jgi:DNA repair protein RecO (recombination protein O)
MVSQLQNALILHTRSYKETSLLLEAFTSSHGRVSLIARGAKRGKIKLASILQPFIPLSILWQGKGELQTLVKAESNGPMYHLYGKRMISGLYINELLMRFLAKLDPHQDLFNFYRHILEQLSFSQQIQSALRIFEKKLLKAIGYELQLDYDADTKRSIMENAYYRFDPMSGPIKVSSIEENNQYIYKGSSLLAFKTENLENADVLREIKHLMRQVLGFHLGARPLRTRKLL